MKIVSNTHLIERNQKIGKYITYVSLAVLAAGLYISFVQPQYYLASFVALIVGFILSQIGIYYGSRWGRSPRPDELLSQSLKGLDDKYTLYHYTSSIPHLLIGPAGIWALLPYSQRGTISYNAKKQRWQQKGGSFYLKAFGQEGLGRPDLDARDNVKSLQSYLDSSFSSVPMPAPQAVLIFTNKEVQVDAAEAPIPAVALEKLKDFIRRKAKEQPAPLDSILLVEKNLPQPEEKLPEKA